VVSTPVGVDGIEAVPGRDFLLAETPETFAGHCLRLMHDPQLGKTLVSNAGALVRERYSQDAINELMARLP
jgi:hypothetical protein